MKDSFKKPYIILLLAAMIFTLVMTFAACDRQGEKDSQSVSDAKPTTKPGDSMTLMIDGPSELTPGQTVQYVIKVTECSLAEGLLSVDFSLEYNAELLEFVSHEFVKLPAESWEGFNRDDGEGIRTFNVFDDSDETLTPVTGADQFEIAVVFKVKEDAKSDRDTLVKLINVTGAINDANISMAYGKGNEIKKA